MFATAMVWMLSVADTSASGLKFGGFTETVPHPGETFNQVRASEFEIFVLSAQFLYCLQFRRPHLNLTIYVKRSITLTEFRTTYMQPGPILCCHRRRWWLAGSSILRDEPSH